MVTIHTIPSPPDRSHVAPLDCRRRSRCSGCVSHRARKRMANSRTERNEADRTRRWHEEESLWSERTLDASRWFWSPVEHDLERTVQRSTKVRVHSSPHWSDRRGERCRSVGGEECWSASERWCLTNLRWSIDFHRSWACFHRVVVSWESSPHRSRCCCRRVSRPRRVVQGWLCVRREVAMLWLRFRSCFSPSNVRRLWGHTFGYFRPCRWRRSDCCNRCRHSEMSWWSHWDAGESGDRLGFERRRDRATLLFDRATGSLDGRCSRTFRSERILCANIYRDRQRTWRRYDHLSHLGARSFFRTATGTTGRVRK